MTKLQFMLLQKTKVKMNGFGLIELMVVCIIIALLLPALHTIAMVPVITQAKALNFQRAEARATILANTYIKNSELPDEDPEGCTIEETEEEDVFTITCIHGGNPRTQGEASATVNLLVQDAGTIFGTTFADENGDGYDDTTGLRTHYDQCYSGFKGSTTDDFKSSSCELGGTYVIPMFSPIYTSTETSTETSNVASSEESFSF